MRLSFFIHESELTGGEGFAMYGPEHLIWLAAAAAAIYLCARWYRGLTAQSRRTARIVIGLLPLLLELLKDGVLLATGHFDWCYLPFQLCGLSIFVELAYALRPNKYVGEVLFALCMPGAAAALLFPNWTNYPVFSFYAMHSFVIHTALVGCVVMLLAAGEIKPDPGRLWCCGVFLLIAAPPLYLLNKRLDTNFMFLNWPSPGSPLVFFAKLFGEPGYLLGYPIMMALVWALMYLPFLLIRRDEAKRASAGCQ